MNNYFGSSISQEEVQRQMLGQGRGQHQQNGDLTMLDTGADRGQQHGHPMPGMTNSPMVGGGGGDAIEEMFRNTSDAFNRERNIGAFGVQYQSPLQLQHAQHQAQQLEAERRMQMMQFGTGSSDFRNFQFGGMSSAQDGMSGGFDGMGGTMGLAGNTSAFPQSNMMAMAGGNNFIQPDMVGNMMAFSNLNMGSMRADTMNMGLFGSHGMGNQYGSPMSNVSPSFSMDMSMGNDRMNASSANTVSGNNNMHSNLGVDGTMMDVERNFGTSDHSDSTSPGQVPEASNDQPRNVFQAPALAKRTSSASTVQPTPTLALSKPTPMSSSTTPVASAIAVAAPVPASASTPAPATPLEAPTPGERAAGSPGVVGPQPDKKRDVYSKTGFDMIRALWYVATRPNPQVRLGAVDMSCAFVVCDVTLNDCPIVYVSDNFQNLTGYSRHEIVGQNCRFLQAPDGKVEAGTKREFVENQAVLNLKNSIAAGKEIQQSLINYRKGGKPFLNLLTMIPIPWDTDEIKFIIGFQIDLVECPDAITGQEAGNVEVSYKHSDIGQYIWTPPSTTQQLEPDSGQTLNADDVSALLQAMNPKTPTSDWHKQSWDKMLLENADDVIHVLSLKGLFLYVSPSAKKILEWDGGELVGNPISSICHPSDIVPVTRELKDTTAGNTVNLVFRIRRKLSGYAWFESHGSLFVEQGKGRKCIVLVGRKRPVFALQRRDLEANGGIGDSEIWTKLSTAGMFLFVSASVRSLLDLLPENLQGTGIQDLMRKESRPEFGRAIEKARRGRIVSVKHEVQNKRGQVLQALTVLYPGDAVEGSKPSFLLAQIKLLKATSRTLAPATGVTKSIPAGTMPTPEAPNSPLVARSSSTFTVASSNTLVTTTPNAPGGVVALPANAAVAVTKGNQDAALAADDNIFDELKTTRCTSWQYELRQMEKVNRLLAEELAQLLSNKKKRKRRKGGGNVIRDCANCHTRNTPEWRRGPSGNRDLCNSCGLRWAKQVCSSSAQVSFHRQGRKGLTRISQTGRVSPRNSVASRGGNGDNLSRKSSSPGHYPSIPSPLGDHSNNNNHNNNNNGHSRHNSTNLQERLSSNSVSASPTPKTENKPSPPILQQLQQEEGGGLMGPPRSQPRLEGGSGMEMSSIREERETSA